MADISLDRILSELAASRDDLKARGDILERSAQMLLRSPAQGGQLAAGFCMTDEQAPLLEDMSDLLGMALNAARMARENRRKRGDDFLTALEEAIGLVAKRGTLGTAHRLLLAGLWASNGLPAPAGLALTEQDIEADQRVQGAAGPEQVAGLLDDLLTDLLKQSEGDALSLHAALAETFPAMPYEMRIHIVEFACARPGPVYAQLGCFWLLDADPAMRVAAAAGLSARLADDQLSAEITAKLIMLRSWMPEDAARAQVDQLLRDALIKGVAAGTRSASWKVHSAFATLPDGGGAQSLAISLQTGGQRSVAMLLLKEGHGIKDAYVIPCTSASDQRGLIKRLTSEAGAQPVPLGYLEQALTMALGEGVTQGVPPAPGLIVIAELCGLSNLRPNTVETEALLKALDKKDCLAELSAQAKGRLINASEFWWDEHEMVRSWFEESDAAHEVLDASKSPRILERDLWKWLGTRREWWARLIARSATVLAAADHKDTDSFIAVAYALLEGRDLKKIPVMLDVHEQTVDAWIADDPNVPQEGSLEEPAKLLGTSLQTRLEKKGELANLLKGTGVTAEGLDGFLLAVVIAPTMIAPNRWIPMVIQPALAVLADDTIQHFVELVVLRANGTIAAAQEETRLLENLSSMTKPGQQEWAEGFLNGYESFQASWPKKSIGRDDLTVLNMIAVGAERGFSGSDLKTLAKWVAARHVRSRMSA